MYILTLNLNGESSNDLACRLAEVAQELRDGAQHGKGWELTESVAERGPEHAPKKIETKCIYTGLYTKGQLFWMHLEVPKKSQQVILCSPRSPDYPLGSAQHIFWTEEKNLEGKRLYRLELIVPEETDA